MTDLADNIGHLLQAGHFDQAQELALLFPDTIWGRVAACPYIEADIQKTSGHIWFHHSQIGNLDRQAFPPTAKGLEAAWEHFHLKLRERPWFQITSVVTNTAPPKQRLRKGIYVLYSWGRRYKMLDAMRDSVAGSLRNTLPLRKYCLYERPGWVFRNRSRTPTLYIPRRERLFELQQTVLCERDHLVSAPSYVERWQADGIPNDDLLINAYNRHRYRSNDRVHFIGLQFARYELGPDHLFHPVDSDKQACRNLPRHLTPYELQWVLPSRTHDITHFRRTT